MRNENLLSTPERRCTWSAKRTWVMLNWNLWRRREVLRWSQQPMEKCRRMKKQHCMSKNWIYSWLWKSSRIRQQYCRLVRFAMNTDTHTSGSPVKNHISLKTVFGYSATRRTSFRSWFLVYQRVLPQACLLQHPWHLQGRKLIILRLPHARLPHQPWHLQTSPTMTSSTVSSESVARKEWRDLCGTDSYPAAVSSKHIERQERRDLCSSGIPEEQVLTKPTKNPKPNENKDQDKERWDLCHSDIPEWLQEFREDLVDDRVPERRDSYASSSHEPSLEPTPARGADLGKHSVDTHFPKDRNCEICQRT